MRPILLPMLLLTACGEAAPNAGSRTETAAPDDGHIECRIGAATEYERFCTVEFADSETGRTLTVRKPDGGFRRLLVTADGRGVVAADGAEPAQVMLIDDDRIEVAIGGDSFRLPATVRAR